MTVWGAQGENCARFLSKGRPVALTAASSGASGRARTARSARVVEIIADSVQFLGGRDEGQGGGGNGFTPQSDVPVNNSDFQPVAAPAGAGPGGRRHPLLGRFAPGPAARVAAGRCASATMRTPRSARGGFVRPTGAP